MILAATAWVAYLLIFVQSGPPVVLLGKHEPFETQQACNSWIENDAQISEFIAKLIDQGAPVISHKAICIQPDEDGKPS